MVMTWNDKADVRLFVNVLKIHNVKLDYVALAAAMGENVTAKAISHRISKLRQVAAEEESAQQSESSATGGADGTANGTTTTTKRTRGTKTTPGKAKAARTAIGKKVASTSATADGPKKRGRKPKNAPKKEPTPVVEDDEEGIASGIADDDKGGDYAKDEHVATLGDTTADEEHVATPGDTTVDEEDDKAPAKKRVKRGKSGSAGGNGEE